MAETLRPTAIKQQVIVVRDSLLPIQSALTSVYCLLGAYTWDAVKRLARFIFCQDDVDVSDTAEVTSEAPSMTTGLWKQWYRGFGSILLNFLVTGIQNRPCGLTKEGAPWRKSSQDCFRGYQQAEMPLHLQVVWGTNRSSLCAEIPPHWDQRHVTHTRNGWRTGVEGKLPIKWTSSWYTWNSVPHYVRSMPRASFSRIVYFRFRKGPTQWTGNQAKVAGHLHRWTRSSLPEFRYKKDVIGGGSRGRWPKKSIWLLPDLLGTWLGKTRLTWSQICWGIWRQKESILKGKTEKWRPGKMQVLCWMSERPRYSMLPLP